MQSVDEFGIDGVALGRAVKRHDETVITFLDANRRGHDRFPSTHV
jgi:hypothetical protein